LGIDAQRELGVEACRSRQSWEISVGGRDETLSTSRKEESVRILGFDDDDEEELGDDMEAEGAACGCGGGGGGGKGDDVEADAGR